MRMQALTGMRTMQSAIFATAIGLVLKAINHLYLCKGVEPVASFAFTLAPAFSKICISGMRPLLTCSASPSY